MHPIFSGLSLITGVSTAITLPPRQSFLWDLVPSEHVQNAVMLNSTQVNLARAVGPMVAGIGWPIGLVAQGILADRWGMNAMFRIGCRPDGRGSGDRRRHRWSPTDGPEAGTRRVLTRT